ncbi:MAG: carboxypeptidase-like regulatory domain-containing protein [Candidatus Korobacteraceae bacterium]
MKSKMKSAMMMSALMLGVCLLFSAAATAQEGMPCTPDPVDMFIMYGNLISCSFDQPGIVDLYRFDGTAGQRIIIEAEGANPCIELVGVTTACGNGGQHWIDTVLTTTQEYTIRVYDYYAGNTGSYDLDLESVVPPSPNGRQMTYGQYLTGQFDLGGDLDVFFFTASVGDVVDIVATGSNPCMTLYAPDTTTSWPVCGNGGQHEIRTQPLTLAGTYTILVYDYYGGNTGPYSVQLQCLSGPCVVTPIPDVSGYVTLQGAPVAGAGVSLLQPGAPGPQLTRTNNNGYYQFLHAIAGVDFTVQIQGPAVPQDFGKPPSGTVDDKTQSQNKR